MIILVHIPLEDLLVVMQEVNLFIHWAISTIKCRVYIAVHVLVATRINLNYPFSLKPLPILDRLDIPVVLRRTMY